MKNISTGAGLVVLGLGVALHPLVSGLVAQATAAPSSSSASAAAAVASAATAQAGPTVVWMGVTEHSSTATWNYHRLWSDGRLEVRSVEQTWGPTSGCSDVLPNPSCTAPWREAPPPPGGNGFACRTDINGDGLVGSSDLSLLLNDWGQEGRCEPNYPCLDLGNLAGGVAFK
jgi:hypothetical protein